jgi:hypothetical protein
MASKLYRAMAASVLSLHAAYIACVIFGTFFTSGGPPGTPGAWVLCAEGGTCVTCLHGR